MACLRATGSGNTGLRMAQHVKNSLGNRLLILVLAAFAAVLYSVYWLRRRCRD